MDIERKRKELTRERYFLMFFYCTRGFFQDVFKMLYKSSSVFFYSLYFNYLESLYNGMVLMKASSFSLYGRKYVWKVPKRLSKYVKYEDEGYRYVWYGFKRCRYKVRLPPRRYKEKIGSYRFLGTAKSMRIIEIYAYKRIHYGCFNERVFFIKPRRVVYFFFCNCIWADFQALLILKSHVWNMFRMRYNEYIVNFFSGWSRLRWSFIRKSRRFFNKPLSLFYHLLQNFSAGLYFGNIVVYKHYHVATERAVMRECESFYYKVLAGSVQVSSYKEDFFFAMSQPRNAFKFKKRSLFFNSFKHMFMLYCFQLVQRSPKKFEFTKSWVRKWFHLFFLASYFRKLMDRLWNFFYHSFERRLIYRNVFSEGFFDAKLVDAFRIEKWPLGDWYTIWLYEIWEVVMVEYLRSGIGEEPLIWPLYLYQWELATSIYGASAYYARWFLLVDFIFLRFFRVFPLVDFVLFNWRMFVYWDIIQMDIVRKYFCYNRFIWEYFPRILLDRFCRDYLISSVSSFYFTVSLIFKFLSVASYIIKKKVVSKDRFFLNLQRYANLYFIRDFVFKIYLNSRMKLTFPVYLFLARRNFKGFFKRWFLENEYLLLRRYVSMELGPALIPSGDESFFNEALTPLWHDFYARKRAIYMRHYAKKKVNVRLQTAALYPKGYKWVKVFLFDWRRKRRVCKSFYFMITGIAPK